MKVFSLNKINTIYGKVSLDENLEAFVEEADIKFIFHYKEQPYFIADIKEKKKKKD